MTSKARQSKEHNQTGEFMNESMIITWIAQGQDVKIEYTQEVTRINNEEIRSDFEESFSFDGITCKKVFTLTGGKLEDLVCHV